MANESGKNERRIPINFWDGTNAIVDKSVAKPQELLHTENARSVIIGTIEKRQGQVVLGKGKYSPRFVSRENYGLAFAVTSYNAVNGLYRLSGSSEPLSSYNVSVHDSVSLVDYVTFSSSDATLTLKLFEEVSITELKPFGRNDRTFFYIDNTDYFDVNIYKYNADTTVWDELSDSEAQGLAAAPFASTTLDGKVFFVNGRDYNRYIDKDGSTVVDSRQTQPAALGSLYNSPSAKLINAYKGRLYLANYTWEGIPYYNTILVSSFPLGIASLIQGDVTAAVASVWTLPVTDNTYLYSDTYANAMEVWRVNTKVADIKINSLDDLNIYVNNADITWHISTHTFLSQDQLYVSGAVTGAKVYRWPNNPTLTGQDIKQYNTFKLAGGDESEITMMVNVGNVMIISNRTVIASWNDFILNYFDLGIGCASRRGYTKAYGALYFIHYTGIYATSGGMPNIISAPMQPYIDGASKAGIEAAVAGKKGRSVFFAIGDVTLYWPDGSVKRQLTDVCLEYNILQQNWYVHTNVPANNLITYLDSTSADRLLMSDSNTGDVKAFLEGNDDDGTTIFFRADTQPLPIASNIEELSNPQLVIIESERGSSMECYISIDDQPYYPLEGTAEKGITRLRVHGPDNGVDRPPVGHYVGLSFRDSSNQRCKIGRLAVTFLPTGTSNPQ